MFLLTILATLSLAALLCGIAAVVSVIRNPIDYSTYRRHAAYRAPRRFSRWDGRPLTRYNR